jgi:leucyl aminopeptidase
VGCKPNEPLISKLEATLLARNVANERADIMNPQAIEDIARDLATKHGLKITVVAGNELLDRGMNLFHAVGQAAQ